MGCDPVGAVKYFLPHATAGKDWANKLSALPDPVPPILIFPVPENTAIFLHPTEPAVLIDLIFEPVKSVPVLPDTVPKTLYTSP